MKIFQNILKKIDQLFTNWATGYIYKVSKTLYPKPDLEDEREDDDDEPILFI